MEERAIAYRRGRSPPETVHNKIQKKEKRMGAFIIFLASAIIIAAAGILIYWIASLVSIGIRRKNRKYDIEEETYKKIIKEIREEQDQ